MTMTSKNTLSTTLAVLLIISAFGVRLTAAEPGYYISFDHTIQADFGGTGTTALATADSNQEAVGMQGQLGKHSGSVRAETLLLPGISGAAFAAGKDAAGRIHTVYYHPTPEMRGSAGTVSFWLKPENWLGDDLNQHVFVSAANGQQRLLIYRIPYESRLAVFLGQLDKPADSTTIFTRVPSWRPGEWHHVVVSWNDRAVQLHLDGVSKAMSELRKTIKLDFTTLAVGEHFGQSDPGRTLIDELRVFDSKLPEDELVSEYRRLADKIQAAAEPVKFTIGRRTPKTDGHIQEGEYPFSTVGIRDVRTHSLSADPGRVCLAYDQDNLYVAAVTPGKDLRTIAKEHDGPVWQDDSIEVLINADNQAPAILQMIFNFNGVRYDARNDETGWSAEGAVSTSTLQDGLWHFECAIPWRALGIAQPPEGRKFWLNVCRNTPASNGAASLAPVMTLYAEAEHLIPVTCDPSACALHVTSLGKPGEGKLNLQMTAASRQAQELKVRVQAPAPIFAFDSEKTIALSPGKEIPLKIIAERLPDKPTLHLTVTTSAGAVIYRNTIPCGTEQPVVMSYIYTDIPKKQLVLVFKNQRLDAGKCKVVVQFLNRQDGRVTHTASADIDDSTPVVNVPFSIAALPPGRYRVLQKIHDPQGTFLYELEDVYSIPEGDGSWVGTKVGISDELPPPWTPVKDDHGTFSCWGRAIRFGGEGVLASIVSQGRELLKGTVALRFNGVPLPFQASLLEAKKDAVKYRLTSSAPDQGVTIDAVAEYDGVVWFTLHLPDGQPKPNSLELVIPLDRQYVDAFDDNSSCYERNSLVKRGGYQFDVDPFEKPFFWCGGNEVGLSGGTHTHRGRYVKDKRRAMTVAVNDRQVTLTVRLVDSPIPDRRARAISFYLQPTPTKPLNPRPWRIRDRINNMMVFNVPRYFNTTRPGHLDDYEKWKYHYGMIIKPHTAKDVTFQYYFAPKGAGSYSEDWNYWGSLWHNSPPQLGNYAGATNDSKRKPKGWTYGCLNCRNYLDYQLDSMAYYLDNPYIDVRDLYFDLSWPRSCGNALHGCVWHDEFGYEHHDNDLLGLREFYRRVWHMVRQKNPDTFIIGHLYSTRTPADTYFDVIVSGEIYETRLLKGNSVNYYGLFTPELMRIGYGTRTNEATVALIGEFRKAVQLYQPDRWKAWSYDEPENDLAIRHFLTYNLVCGLSPYFFC
ncbi:MAG: hypothetical protein IJJ33_06260, partial [Victivallales bacterium]|nr:hypothetical protein [Victivallales bacterium]